ncbi:nitroreductase [Fluviibacter phosphoraccumulans]|jgi:nitroreductase|uniref:Nitroreductase n=1 Tax=Fluviibacter phosphoraccumulans TaxID=1751046 RepID=A0A679I9D0_9RHOO|nr:nitroreductase [Fluviibacter phosphoraccumulans]BBU69257.1 nitroreductase [Fluviibacter phosphoraccumulans]BBU71587.1 nitroreductase [Fluviibacter phosphoraccumulans]BCA65192.1 nitroreductase [Fluviibacter phosphoraccumulans]HBI84606.1 nitrobenzoate reductase [Alcaligenaceae bacterium]
MTHSVATMVDQVIRDRRSVRAFLPTPVPRSDIEAILEIAARAPSGTNTQPWQVYVLSGARKQALSDEIVQTFFDPNALAQHHEEYDYYPATWVEPFLSRRRKIGLDLYGLLGLTRDNLVGMKAQQARNYQFFDAPVGLIFTLDRVMGQGSLLDYGMFMQNIMIAARARGLDTCPQAAFNQFHKIIARQLDLPASQKIICGMALGYADPSKIENTLETVREPLANFAHFLE